MIGNASHPEIVATLLARGENPAALETDVLRDFIGLGTIDWLDATPAQYRRGRERTFGKRNPQRIDNPFWNAMVKCGWPAYRADDLHGATDCGKPPTWCHHRFGMSLTPLPDGRYVQIAGEHEDSYDTDFCIYNDVIVHDGAGSFQIFGYPRETFPPTDFHSATRVEGWIYLVGSLGYMNERGTRAQVYRLNLHTFAMERVETRGEDPGWISRHKATRDGDRLVVTGGNVFLNARFDGGGNYVVREATHALDLQSHRWHRVE